MDKKEIQLVLVQLELDADVGGEGTEICAFYVLYGFVGVTAGEGWFSVRHFGGSGWRWRRVITFRYDRGWRQFLLAADGGRSWHVDSPKNGTRIVNRPEDFGRVTFHEFSYNRAFEKKQR